VRRPILVRNLASRGSVSGKAQAVDLPERLPAMAADRVAYQVAYYYT